MKTEEFTTIMLTADEGHFLTEREDVPILQRTVATTVAVGRNDSAENWVEISAEEAEKYIKEHREAIANEGSLTDEDIIPNN